MKLSEIKHSRAPKHLSTSFPSSWIGGVNPLLGDYLKSDSTQGPQPKKEDVETLPIYLPVGAKDTMGNGKPVNVVSMLTRKELLNDGVAGEVANIYSDFFKAWVFLALTIVSLLFVNVYLAGGFAYLAGRHWSKKEIGIAWSVDWWKGKMLVHTD